MTKTKVVLIIGLPGSGKSHYIDENMDYCNDPYKNDIVFDDITKDQIASLISLIGNTDKILVADPHLCNPANLEIARELLKDADIEEVYFENNPEQCRLNVEYRNDDRKVASLIKLYSKIYDPPSTALKIWRCPVK